MCKPQLKRTSFEEKIALAAALDRYRRKVKAARIVMATKVRTARVAALNDDIMSIMVYPYLDLVSHMKVACVCRTMLAASGIPPAPPKTGSWVKLVRIPLTFTTSRLRRLMEYARPTSLSLSDNFNFRDHTLVDLVDPTSPQLQELDLSRTRGFSFQCPGLLTMWHKGLLSLTLRRCYWFGDTGARHMSSLQYLQKLDVSGTYITNRGMAHLSKMPALTDLALNSCLSVTDPGLACLVELPLKTLELTYCHNLTDAGLLHLLALPLETLLLDGIESITDRGLAHLRGLPLKKISLSSQYITDGGLTHLRRPHASDTPILQIEHGGKFGPFALRASTFRPFKGVFTARPCQKGDRLDSTMEIRAMMATSKANAITFAETMLKNRSLPHSRATIVCRGVHQWMAMVDYSVSLSPSQFLKIDDDHANTLFEVEYDLHDQQIITSIEWRLAINLPANTECLLARGHNPRCWSPVWCAGMPCSCPIHRRR
jgi:hypothetical protein